MTRLLILWLLAERPLTGYEIKKALTDQGMRFWFELEDGSIYSALRTLTKHGHTRIVGTEQEGNRPQRTRYRITAAGKRHYRQLLIDALRTPALPVAPIDVALAAQGDLDPTAVTEALAARTKRLRELGDHIDVHRTAAPSGALVDRNQALVHAELEWLARLDHRTTT
ncbi:MAG: PadR family transcriptional regulator [Actinomycetota bacterium]